MATWALRFRALKAGEHLLPLPADLPGQRVWDLALSKRPIEVYEASGNALARFALEEGEVLEVRFSLRPEPLAHDPPWREALLREPPEAWPGILAHRGHRVERALGFLLSGRPHTWFLVDDLPLDPVPLPGPKGGPRPPPSPRGGPQAQGLPGRPRGEKAPPHEGPLARGGGPHVGGAEVFGPRPPSPGAGFGPGGPWAFPPWASPRAPGPTSPTSFSSPCARERP
jgi:hypothetical protein